MTEERRQWVDGTLSALTLEQKIGQMLQLRYFADYRSFDDPAFRELKKQIAEYHIGSLVLNLHYEKGRMLRPSPRDAARVANELQRGEPIPLLLAADLERGAASRLNEVPSFPWPMTFGAANDPAQVKRFAEIVAREARSIGVQWVLAPVADLNSNPVNPIINVRSFGEDPHSAETLIEAYIRGAHAHGLLVTAKHFPGHGSTAVDSHVGVPVIEGDLEQLKKNELVPFDASIRAGVDAILLAHARVPDVDTESDSVVTVSPRIVSGLLKRQLQFRGVVLTDALNMHSLAESYAFQGGSPTARAAIDAVKAGCDVIMWPTDLDGAYRGLIDAVHTGEIPESRINESVRKVLMMKASVGLDTSRFVDVDVATDLASKPEDYVFAQQVADRGTVLVRDSGKVIPIDRAEEQSSNHPEPPSNQAAKASFLSVVLAESLESDTGAEFEKELKARRPDAVVLFVDRRTADAAAPRVLEAVAKANKVIVLAYVTPREARQVAVDGTVKELFGLVGPPGRLLNRILAVAADKTAVVAMGSPYLILSFPSIKTYVCTFSIASTTEFSAVKAMFSEIQNDAKLPITLPGIAPLGYSVSWPSTNSRPTTP